MNIADLFVNIKVGGAESTKKAFDNVNEGVQSVKKMSIEAKAAILGVFYGLQQVTSASMNQGQSLTNFSALTGQNMKMLQQYSYALKLAGGSGEEMASTLKGLQSKMTALSMGKPVEGLLMLNEAFKAIGKSALDPKRVNDLGYVMRKLTEIGATSKISPAARRQVLSPFVSDSIQEAMATGKFSSKILASAPSYSSKEAQGLDKMKSGFTEIIARLEVAIGKMLVTFGPQLMEQLKSLASALVGFTTIVTKLLVKSKIGEGLEGIGYAMENPTSAFEEIQKVDKAWKESMDESIGEFVNKRILKPMGIKERPVEDFYGIFSPMQDKGRKPQSVDDIMSKKRGGSSVQEATTIINLNATYQNASPESSRKSVDLIREGLAKEHKNAVKSISKVRS